MSGSNKDLHSPDAVLYKGITLPLFFVSSFLLKLSTMMGLGGESDEVRVQVGVGL